MLITSTDSNDFKKFLTTENGITKISKYYKNTKNDVKIFMNSTLVENLQKEAVDQLVNVNDMEYCYESLGLPDLHPGYGFPIGSVSAFKGVVSPLGVGYDINCGVRALVSDCDKFSIDPKLLADKLNKTIPSGMYDKNNKSDLEIDIPHMNDIMEKGLKLLNIDTELIENNGHLDADPKNVTQKARSSAINTIGTLGSGNHFLEVQYVDEIFDVNAANAMGIKRKNQVVIMIHTGSRGLGYKVCESYIPKSNDNKLACYEIKSEIGANYMSAMGCSANFAFFNRHVIATKVIDIFKNLYHVETQLIYDVSHNIAKKVNVEIDGVIEDLVIHRKGASQSLPPFHKDCPEKYSEFGQPVPIGGSMGTSSYIMCGYKSNMINTFESTCHGAGRILSRGESVSKFTKESVVEDLYKSNVEVRCKSDRELREEAPKSYKDVDVVVNSCIEAKLNKKICRMKPIVVIKG
ncbi:tRNA-splicing ligase RtcB [Dictyocoela muelleri]|nr:tRNA-splicing ligase RtcB [Dictyocoela muelleri]